MFSTSRSRACSLLFALLCAPLAIRAQEAAPAPAAGQNAATAQPPEQPPSQAAESKPAAIAFISPHNQRESDHEARLAEHAIKKGDLEDAERHLAHAVQLAPGNTDYLKRNQQVRAALMRQYLNEASVAREADDMDAASKALAKAVALDPDDSLVQQEATMQAQHLPAEPMVTRDPSQQMHIEGGYIHLDASKEKFPLQLRSTGRQLVEDTFKRFGLIPVLDDSVPSTLVQADTEPLDFEHAAATVMLLTDSFYVPLDAHRVLIAKDTKENRDKFEREFVETIYLPGLSTTDIQDTSNVLRQLLDVKQVSAAAGLGKISIRAPQHTLEAANALLEDLWRGNSQVLLSMTLFEIQRYHERDLGAQLPSEFGVFYLPALENSVEAQYASEIAQLISSGAIPPNNPLAALIALVAAGILNTAPFNNGLNGISILGSGLGATAITNNGATGNISMNSSDVRQVAKLQLRVGNGEQATFRNGSRYPIITSSFTAAASVSALAAANIPGYSQLVNSATSVAAATPQIQYQDLGLTLKAKPAIQTDRAVSMLLELTITSLGGSSLNGNPILNNRELKTTIAVPEGEESVIAATISKQEQRSLTGIPFINEIPGFPGTNEDKTVTSDELVIVLTPHIVRMDHDKATGPLLNLPLH